MNLEFKDYDEIEIIVNPYEITSITPNPIFSTATIQYKTENASSAYFIVTKIDSGSNDNYIIDTNGNDTTIDFTNYSSGLYKILLVCDGEVFDIKTFTKE